MPIAQHSSLGPVARIKRFCTACLSTLVLLGCGGGGGGSAQTSPTAAADTQGSVIIALTDAPGAFLEYSVDVRSLTLQRSNGDLVEVLPLQTRVDFSNLVELTEILNIATVPAGTYSSASIELDFSAAGIVVQDEQGNAHVALAVDAEGIPLSVVEVALELTGRDRLVIVPGMPAALSIDFDLAASNAIDLSTDPVLLTVEPFLLATAELERGREHRVRGLLQAADPDNQRIDLVVRPFRHHSGRFGELSLTVQSATEYEVNGSVFTGDAGLQAVTTLPVDAPVVAHVMQRQGALIADRVLAGSSVPWSDADVVRGVVAARSGDLLTVKGAIFEFADGRSQFRGTVFVQLSGSTGVTSLQDSADAQSVSIGQRIVAWGEQIDDVTLAASRVQKRINQLTAEVVQVEPLAVDLFYLNGRAPRIFDFSGTGVVPEEDADPDFYDIESGLLTPAGLVNGDLVRVRGWTNDFGAAPADFLARTIIDVNTDHRAAVLSLAWPEGTAQPFVDLGGNQIQVDLQDARKSLAVRGVPRAYLDLLDDLILIPSPDDRGAFAVKVRGQQSITTFRDFADLVDALIRQLDAGHTLHRINAVGQYNTGTSEMTIWRAGFVFHGDDIEA